MSEQKIELTKSEVDNLTIRLGIIKNYDSQLSMLRESFQFYIKGLLSKYNLDESWKWAGDFLIKDKDKVENAVNEP